MRSLAEIQSGVREALVTGQFASIAPLFVGGGVAEHRLAIHHRHYEVSLTRTLVDKFPGTIWLIGSQFLTEAARVFIAKYPPTTPCIAEYGESFPSFLAECEGTERAPYLQRFAELEWHIGHIAIATDEPPVSIEELRSIRSEVLPDIAVVLQSGVRYLESDWPVDELMKVYLSAARPERFEFEPAHVNLEIRGARGEFTISRLGGAEFSFRKSILRGLSIGEAADEALESDGDFDAGNALVSLFANGLVSEVQQRTATNHL